MTYGTRRFLALGVTAAAFSLVSSPAIAQVRGLSAPRFARDLADDSDGLRRYGSRSATKDARVEPARYTRSRPTPREPVERPTPPSRSSASYFAGLRTGQGPNRNTYQPSSQTLLIPIPRCHPGRGALLGR